LDLDALFGEKTDSSTDDESAVDLKNIHLISPMDIEAACAKYKEKKDEEIKNETTKTYQAIKDCLIQNNWFKQITKKEDISKSFEITMDIAQLNASDKKTLKAKYGKIESVVGGFVIGFIPGHPNIEITTGTIKAACAIHQEQKKLKALPKKKNPMHKKID
jgi:hypothetical protein